MVLPILLLFLGAASANAFERPTVCSDPFRLDEAGLGEPQYFLSGDSATVPITLRGRIDLPSDQTPELYFEARFDAQSRLRTVMIHLDGPDHVLSYEYHGREVIQHCRPVYRPPKRPEARKPVGGANR